MRKDFFIIYLLLVIVQMFICNYFHLSAYIYISLLPVLIFCIPTKYNTIYVMLIAFVTGLAVDLFAEGLIGINCFSLVPVAFCRKGLYQLIFGDEILIREGTFSIKKYGYGKVGLAVFICQLIFLSLYIWADSAGTRTTLFNIERLVVSLIVGTIISLLIVEVIQPNERR